MGLTVSTMDTNLSNLLGDPNGYRWNHTRRMIAINQAQRDVANIVLGMGSKQYPTFGVLTQLQAASDIAVGGVLDKTLRIKYGLRSAGKLV